MTPEEHERLEDWAKKYAVLGLCGFLSGLLIIGKGIHLPLSRTSSSSGSNSGLLGGGGGGGIFSYFFALISIPPVTIVLPPAILSGFLGLLLVGVMEYVDETLTTDLTIGLDSFKLTMVNFMFASLTLGLFCSRSSSQHSNLRAIFFSILHEGIPMVIYSQILIWGQSSVCLLIYCLFYINSPNVPHLVSAMVPLGVEVGNDVVPTAVYKNAWSQTVVQEAETLGLFTACFLGVVAVTVKNRYVRGPWNESSSGRNDFYISSYTGSADYEAFGRVTESPLKPRRSSSTSTTPSLSQRVTSNSSQPTTTQSTPFGLSVQIPLNSQDKPSYQPLTGPSPRSFSRVPARESAHSSLGSHISFIFISVFFAFCFGLISRTFESQNLWLKAHRILSSIRMFELSIFFAFLLIQFSLTYTKLNFKSEWFMRLCGLALDLVIIASLTSALPRPDQIEQVNYGLVGVFVIACAVWNIVVFIFLGRKMFPNFWFERGVTLTGEALGHSATGLLFARALDPSMNTPVPFSYACKQMLFAIFPSSGGKNTIVVSLVASHGPWLAFIVSCCVVFAWGFIFEKYIRGRYLNPRSSTPSIEKSNASTSSGSLPLVRSRSESDIFRDNLSLNSSVSENRYPSDWSAAGSYELGTLNYDEVGSRESDHLAEVLEFDDEDHHKDPLLNDTAPLLVPTPSTSSQIHSANTFPPPVVVSSVPGFRMNSVSGMISPSHLSTIMSWILPDYQHSLVQLSLLYTLQRDGASLATLLSCSTQPSSSMNPPHQPVHHHHHQHLHHHHHATTDDIFHSSLTTTSSTSHFTPRHQIILLIEDSWGYVFGGYLSHPLKISPEYYGNGEDFVFALLPQPAKYSWTRRNEYFILSNYQQIILGGGGNGYSIQLDDELNTGVSNTSDTFLNPVLSSNEFFKCLNVEVWAIESAV